MPDPTHFRIFGELQRRNVFRVGAAYVVTAWVVAQVAELITDSFGAPAWVIRFILISLGCGFPVAVIVSWIFELTPEGLRREKNVHPSQSKSQQVGRQLDFVIIGVLVSATGYLLVDKMLLSDNVDPARATAPQSVPSVAVLPFENVGDDPTTEYFSDGLSEELLNLLAQIPEIRVIARSSSFSYRGKGAKISDIADELNVAHVLEGSVRKWGNRLRITTKLVRASDSSYVWSDVYEKNLTDIFDIQDEIAGAVVGQLRGTILGDELEPRFKPESTGAYALYLQGWHLSDRLTKADLEQSIDYFRRAIALEPNFALPWVELSSVYARQADAGYINFETGYAEARSAAERAVELDPDLANAHDYLGWHAMSYDWDWAAAQTELDLALKLDPRNEKILRHAGNLALIQGNANKAIELILRSVGVSPLSDVSFHDLGVAYFYAGKLDDAAAAFRKTLELEPAYPGARYRLAMVQLSRADANEALKTIEMESDEIWRMVGLPMIHHALENSTESNADLENLIAAQAPYWAYQIAEIFAYRGDIDLAFEWLNRAYTQRDSGLSKTKGNPLLRNLEGDIRYAAFLQKTGL